MTSSTLRKFEKHWFSNSVEVFGRTGESRNRIMQPTPVFLPGKSHGQRSLEGCSPWGRKESGTTERLILTYLLTAKEKRYGINIFLNKDMA